MERLHRSQFAQSARVAPGRETPRGIEIGPARVIVVDLRSEEFQHALRSLGRRREQRRRLQCG
jgi:hypothetical protein